MSSDEKSYGREPSKKHLDSESYEEESDKAERLPTPHPKPRKRNPALISQGVQSNEAFMDYRESTKEYKSGSESEDEKEYQHKGKDVKINSRAKADVRKSEMEKNRNIEDGQSDDERHVNIREKKLPFTGNHEDRNYGVGSKQKAPRALLEDEFDCMKEDMANPARRQQKSGYSKKSDESDNDSNASKLRERRIGQKNFSEMDLRRGKGKISCPRSESESESDNMPETVVRGPGGKTVKENTSQRSTTKSYDVQDSNSDSDHHSSEQKTDGMRKSRARARFQREYHHEDEDMRVSRHGKKEVHAWQTSDVKRDRYKSDSSEGRMEVERPHHLKSSISKNMNRSESSEDSEGKDRDYIARRRKEKTAQNMEIKESDSDENLHGRRNIKNSSQVKKKNDSDSDCYHLKEAKNSDKVRLNNSNKSYEEYGYESRPRYNQENQSESSDSFVTNKGKLSEEDSYRRHAPRRRKDMTSTKDFNKYGSAEKIKYQRNTDEGDSYGERFNKQMVDIDVESRRQKEIQLPTSQHEEEGPSLNKNKMGGNISRDFQEKHYTNREDRYRQEMLDSNVNSGRGKKYGLLSNEYEGGKPDGSMNYRNDYSPRNRQEKYANKEYKYHEEILGIEERSHRRNKLESPSNLYDEQIGRDRNQYEVDNANKGRYRDEPSFENDIPEPRKHRFSEKEWKSGAESMERLNYQEQHPSKEQFVTSKLGSGQNENDFSRSRPYNIHENKISGRDPAGRSYPASHRRHEEVPLDYQGEVPFKYQNYGKSSRSKESDGPLVSRNGNYTQTTGRRLNEESTYHARHPGPDEEIQYENHSQIHRKISRGDDKYINEPFNGRKSSNHFEYDRDVPHGWSKQTISAGRYEKPDMQSHSRLTAMALISKLLQAKNFQISTNSLRKSGLNPFNVKTVVDENSHLFHIVEGLDEAIALRPQIKICSSHLQDGCGTRSSCFELHICPRFIQAKCSNTHCVMGHNLRTRHNANVLEDFSLKEIPDPDILEVLKLVLSSSKASQQLKICNDYNNSNCKRYNCCYLHICIDYITFMQCGRRNCYHEHDILSRHNTQILGSLGIDTNESPRDVIRVIKDKYPYLVKQQSQLSTNGSHPKRQEIRQNAAKSDVQQTRRPQTHDRSNVSAYNDPQLEARRTRSGLVETENYHSTANVEQSDVIWCDYYQGNTEIPEICYYSVTGQCRYEERGCRRLHADRHFHWQVKQRSKGWINLRLQQVEALERSYCNPNEDGVTLPPLDPRSCPKEIRNLFGDDTWQAHFPAMLLRNPKSGVALDLRRIFSENVDGNVKCAYNAWYFLDPNGTWIKYGKTDTTNRDFLASNVTSQDIQNHFQRTRGSPMTFKNSMFTYILDFKAMTQTNTSTNVTRKVKCRPEPHLKAKSWSSSITSIFKMS